MRGTSALMLTLLGGLLAGCADQAGAKSAGPVTPATIDQVLKSARGGERITLAPGDYGALTVPRRVFSPGITLDAKDARFSGIVLTNVQGVAVDGGTIVGPGGRSYGVSIRNAKDIRIEGMRIGGAHRGIVVGESDRVALVRNTLSGLISEGINVALSSHVLIDRNTCRDFNPAPPVFAADGSRVRDGDHPDCIQAWSRPTHAPTSDLTITNNDMEGHMQGIFLGNHVRDGVDDGGFDRVIVRDNRVHVTMPQGIALYDVRGGEVRGNSVRTISGSMLPARGGRPARPVHTMLRVQNSPSLTVCGNDVEEHPKLEMGRKRC